MPPLFKTPYGEPLMKVLQAYPPNSPGLIVALEAVVSTAMNRAVSAATADLSTKTCRGLHMGKPGQGVVCASCFEHALHKGGIKEADPEPPKEAEEPPPEAQMAEDFVKKLLG